MGRSPCCSKVGLRRGPWSTKEDTLLTDYIQQHGEGEWKSLPKKAGLVRCGKSCRLRWMNYLRPGIIRGNISEDEEDLIIRLHGLLGNRWSLIAGRLPGRTDNEIKNHWNVHLLKKLKHAGFEPKPHKDFPKPSKIKKSAKGDGAAIASGKRKYERKKMVNAVNNSNSDAADDNKLIGEQENEQIIDIPKTKVYQPKPIKLSSVLSRTYSYDSLVSGALNSKGSHMAEKAAEMAWTSLFDLEDANYRLCGGDKDDLVGCGNILPVLNQSDPIWSGGDSLDGVASNSYGSDAVAKAAEVVSYSPAAWPPLFELDDANYGVCRGGDEDDFLGLFGGCPVTHIQDIVI